MIAAQVIRVSEYWMRRTGRVRERRAFIIRPGNLSLAQRRGSSTNPEESLGRLTVLIVRFRCRLTQVMSLPA